MEERNIWEWADEAVSCLLRPTERDVARRELLDHMEDHLQVLRDRGLDEDEAQARVMEAMGDPRETGRLLRKVHAPWAGVLLWLVRALFLALLIPALVYAGSLWQKAGTWFESRAIRDRYVAGSVEAPADSADYEGPAFVLTASRRGSCEAAGEAGGHEVSVLAAWNRWIHAAWNDKVTQDCYVVLRVKTPPWETPDADVLERNFRVSADGAAPTCGYLHYLERGEDFPPYSFTVWRLRRNLWSCDYLLKLERPDDPDRLDLIYAGGSESFTLPVVFGPRTEAKGGQTP